MNNDLISRSALHRMISLDTKHGAYGEFMDGSEVSYTSREVHTMINEAPAVDAVEVVRCKDCRYLKTCNRTIELIPRQAQIGYLRCVVHSCENGERRSDA